MVYTKNDISRLELTTGRNRQVDTHSRIRQRRGTFVCRVGERAAAAGPADLAVRRPDCRHPARRGGDPDEAPCESLRALRERDY
jgi:hypothetical protein